MTRAAKTNSFTARASSNSLARSPDLRAIIWSKPGDDSAEEWLHGPLRSQGVETYPSPAESQRSATSIEDDLVAFVNTVIDLERSVAGADVVLLFQGHAAVVSPHRLVTQAARFDDPRALLGGCAFRYGDERALMGSPFVRANFAISSSCIVLSRHGYARLVEFCQGHRARLRAWETGVCGFLSSFVQSGWTSFRSLAGQIDVGYPGRYRRIPLDAPPSVIDNVGTYRRGVLTALRAPETWESNLLTNETHDLVDLDWNALSSYKSCGRRGVLFDGDSIPIAFSRAVDTSKSVGFHAPSHLFLQVETEAAYHLALAAGLCHSARQPVDFAVWRDRVSRPVWQARLVASTLVTFDVPIAPGRTTIVIEAAPTAHHDHFAHAFIQGATFVKRALREYMTGEDID